MRFNKEYAISSVLMFVIIASALDLYTDLAHGAPVSHMLKELVILLLAALLVIWILYEQHLQSREIKNLRQELEQIDVNQEAMSDYVLGARKQLGEVIVRQFTDWNLTASEKEVGWLLLKGLSLREISALRETLEKTVRQQASSIYKKAGLNGRHAFAAWFIEDLF